MHAAGYKDDPKPVEKSIEMLGKMLVRVASLHGALSGGGSEGYSAHIIRFSFSFLLCVCARADLA